MFSEDEGGTSAATLGLGIAGFTITAVADDTSRP
jgi:hypothetical protein